jgi:hypothetical protein
MDYDESDRSIEGYAATAEAYGFPLTLFIHPEIAQGNRALLLNLQRSGACLGLHLHPYKFLEGRYAEDLGAYDAAEQRMMLSRAAVAWEQALGQRPRYFRGGYFSANDSTFGVLADLGFRGGSLSIPGRVLPEHCSVWAGADPYPHRADLAFRQRPGSSGFVEVPVSVDYRRPVQKGTAGEQGYEWPYVPAWYDHREVVRHIIERVVTDLPKCGAIVLDTHNDQEFLDVDHPASQNLELILGSIQSLCAAANLQPIGATLETICDLLLLDR